MSRPPNTRGDRPCHCLSIAGLYLWIKIAVTKTVVLLLSNLNNIKKHVEDISVDAALGCKFCCVVIYDANYNINNSIYSKLPLSPLSQSRYQLGSSSNTVMHIISVNMSAQPHCQVWDKQEWSDNRDYIILQFATLPTCNFLCEHFSAFNKTYTYIRQQCKKCTLWCFVYTKLSKAAIFRQWNNETAGCWNYS